MVCGEFRAHAELAVRMFSEGVGSMGRLDAEGVRTRVPIIEALIQGVRKFLGQ